MDRQGNSENHEPTDPLEQFLRELLGPEGAAEAASAMRAQGFNLDKLSGLGDSHAMHLAMSQFRRMMESTDEPVNWRMVQQLSVQQAYRSGDPRITGQQKQQVAQALTAADLWLDPITSFVITEVRRDAWTRAKWIEETLPGWKEIANPVAFNASAAMEEALTGQLDDHGMGLPEQLSGLASSLSSMLPKLAAMAFAAQVGQVLAAMSQESFGAHDSGLPLTSDGTTALVPKNVAVFGEGLNVNEEEVTQYLAVRECAHARLFASVPWLKHNLLVALRRYAEQIAIDPEAIASAARSINPTDPNSVTSAMENGVFAVDPTPAQAEALDRLQTLLALIEGWVEVVTSEATRPYLPDAFSLREMIRRRRVTGSSSETLLKQLVGLELRPRHARGAARIFQRLQDKGGPAARDEVWAHPDRVPTSADLTDPDRFFEPKAEESSEFDEKLEALLSGTLGWDEAVPADQRGLSEPTDDQDPADLADDSEEGEGEATADSQPNKTGKNDSEDSGDADEVDSD